MANRYNDQDYPRYNERDDRYDSRSEYDDSSRHNREFRERDRGRGSDRGAGYYGTGYDRDSAGNFGRNAENDRTDYTLYGYDRDNQYSSGSDEERGYYNRGGDYGYGSNFGSSGANFDRMDASDYTRRENRDYGRGRERFTQGGGYRGDYIRSERGWETENRDGSNRNDRGWWDKTTDEISSWFGDDDAARRRERDMRQSGGQTSYRGKGPKNYRRSDERIGDDINDRLTDYPYLDASDIETEVKGGEVVLTGTVESRYAKRMAEDIVEDVSGVSHVENRLRVRQNTSNFGSSGSGNFSSGESSTSAGGNSTTGGTTGMTGDTTGISTEANTTTGNLTPGESSIGNTGDTNMSSTTGRSRSKSA